MNQLSATPQRKDRKYAVMMLAAVLMLLPCAYYAAPFAFAAPDTGAVIEGVISIVKLIANIVGVIFFLVGLLRFAIAQANEDGPGTQKAVMMLATGIVLLLLGLLVIDRINFASWIGI